MAHRCERPRIVHVSAAMLPQGLGSIGEAGNHTSNPFIWIRSSSAKQRSFNIVPQKPLRGILAYFDPDRRQDVEELIRKLFVFLFFGGIFRFVFHSCVYIYTHYKDRYSLGGSRKVGKVRCWRTFAFHFQPSGRLGTCRGYIHIAYIYIYVYIHTHLIHLYTVEGISLQALWKEDRSKRHIS